MDLSLTCGDDTFLLGEASRCMCSVGEAPLGDEYPARGDMLGDGALTRGEGSGDILRACIAASL